MQFKSSPPYIILLESDTIMYRLFVNSISTTFQGFIHLLMLLCISFLKWRAIRCTSVILLELHFIEMHDHSLRYSFYARVVF